MIKTAKKKELESDIVKEICQWLDAQGYFFWRQNNTPIFGRNNAGKMTFRSMPKYARKGVPDIIIVSHGKFIGMEVKREGNGLSKDQAQFGRELVDNGGSYVTVFSLEGAKIAMANYPKPKQIYE